ncbi:unnamed protein product [Urochloa humidicola]
MLDYCLQILQTLLLAGTAQYCLGMGLHGSLLVWETSSSSLDLEMDWYCVGNDHESLDEYVVLGSARDSGVAENLGAAAVCLCLLDLMN